MNAAVALVRIHAQLQLPDVERSACCSGAQYDDVLAAGLAATPSTRT